MELSEAIYLIRHPSLLNRHISNWADFGCGTGLFTNALAALLPPHCTIYAVDSNQKAFGDFMHSANLNVQKIIADFVKDDLDIPALDGILMANSLHFVKEKISFIQKARKYLKQNGCFVLVEYDMDRVNPWVSYPSSFLSTKALFEKTGSKSVSKIGELSSVYNREGIYSLLVEW